MSCYLGLGLRPKMVQLKPCITNRRLKQMSSIELNYGKSRSLNHTNDSQDILAFAASVLTFLVSYTEGLLWVNWPDERVKLNHWSTRLMVDRTGAPLRTKEDCGLLKMYMYCIQTCPSFTTQTCMFICVVKDFSSCPNINWKCTLSLFSL